MKTELLRLFFVLGMITAFLFSEKNVAAQVSIDAGWNKANRASFGDEFRAVAALPNGKVYGVGYAFQPHFSGATAYSKNSYIARVNSDGTLDTAFNGNGILFVDMGRNTAAGISYDDEPTAVVVQADGKVLVSGVVQYPANAGGLDTYLFRVNPNGSFDSAFGAGGQGVVDLGSGQDDRPNTVLLQSDGKVVIAGYRKSNAAVGVRKDMLVARLLSNGAFDTAFGGSGLVVADAGQGQDDEAYDAAIRSDGRILLAGSAMRRITPTSAGFARNTALVQFLSNGALDTSFNGSGGSIVDLAKDPGNQQNYDDEATSVAIRPDGKIIIGGYGRYRMFGSTGFNTNSLFARYLANGTLDTSFGTGGSTVLDFGFESVGGSYDDRAIDVAALADGKTIATGWLIQRQAPGSNAFGTNLYVTRLLDNGSTDGTFGSGGTTLLELAKNAGTGFRPDAEPSSVSVLPDGRIVVGGYAYQSVPTPGSGNSDNSLLTRFSANGLQDSTFVSRVFPYHCDDGLDNDGDGLVDLGDPGCKSTTDVNETNGSSPFVSSPAFIKWNTYLKQWNFLELVSNGPNSMTVGIEIYNARSERMISESIVLRPETEFDFDLNDAIRRACSSVNPASCSGFADVDGSGVIDSFGVIVLRFLAPTGTNLVGRMSNYRPDAGTDSFSFAFPRELRPPTKGRTYAVANTYDPQNLGYLVPNFGEIIHIGNSETIASGGTPTPGRYTVNIFDQAGKTILTQRIPAQNAQPLSALGEIDFEAGHQIVNPSTGGVVESVYLVEVIPDDPNAEYLFSVARYSSNAPAGVAPSTYNYALAIPGRAGAASTLYAPLTNETYACGTSTNWVEVANVSSSAQTASIRFRNSRGEIVGRAEGNNATFSPKSQIHFNGSGFLAAGDIGSVEIVGGAPGSFVVQSMVYVRACNENRVDTAYVSLGRVAGRQIQAGTVNTFLGMRNFLRTWSTSTANISIDVNLKSFTNATFQTSHSLPAMGANNLLVNDAQGLNFPADQYGSAKLSGPAANRFLGEIFRVRTEMRGGRPRVDFVLTSEIG